MFQQLAVAISAVFLFWGSASCLNMPVRDLLMALFLVFVAIWSYTARWYIDRVLLVQLPVFGLTGMASVFVGCAFLRFRRQRKFVGAGLLFMGFVLWGVFLAGFPLAEQYRQFVGTAFLISTGLQLFIAVSMIVLVLEEVRQNAKEMQRELNAVNAEKRSLQMKMLSAEQNSAVVTEKELPENLHEAYVELRRTHHSVVQQERLRALGQMASGIAHDINNSLCGVLTFSELLLERENLSSAARKNVKQIRTAGEEIARLVARMGDFYRRRTSRDELSDANIYDLVNQVIELTRPRWRDMAQRNGATIQVETNLERALPQFNCEEGELRDALANLVLNSVDAMPGGGTITISASTRTVGEQRQLLLEIADTGVGMTEEVRKRCLEPFFSTRGQRGSSGLGLAMVYGVVQRHEGNIAIESELGQGTKVRLSFPLGVMQESATDEEASPKDCPPLHILCVDDEPLLREMLEEVLQGNGHRVALAADGKEGLTAFNRTLTDNRPFDVVITDFGMPIMDGLELAHHIKARSPRTPIILLTGWGALITQNATEAAVFDTILSKPPHLGDLMTALGRASRFTQPGILGPTN
jgi:signal transduction histidine kinase/ActR/RegA family two-component response regulator